MFSNTSYDQCATVKTTSDNEVHFTNVVTLVVNMNTSAVIFRQNEFVHNVECMFSRDVLVSSKGSFDGGSVLTAPKVIFVIYSDSIL